MKLTYKCTHSFDGDNDVELSILFEYTPPAPQRGPTYSCAGEPAGYTEVEVISMRVDGVPATHDQLCDVDTNTRLYEEMEIYGAEYRAELRGE